MAPSSGTDEVDPEVGPLPGGERRPERARRIHRCARDRAAEKRVEPDGPADRDRCGRADRPSIGSDGHDHEHQEGGQDDLVDEGAADSDARDGGAEVSGLVRPDRKQEQRAEHRSGQLCGDVAGRVAQRESAA